MGNTPNSKDIESDSQPTDRKLTVVEIPFQELVSRKARTGILPESEEPPVFQNLPELRCVHDYFSIPKHIPPCAHKVPHAIQELIEGGENDARIRFFSDGKSLSIAIRPSEEHKTLYLGKILEEIFHQWKGVQEEAYIYQEEACICIDDGDDGVCVHMNNNGTIQFTFFALLSQEEQGEGWGPDDGEARIPELPPIQRKDTVGSLHSL